MVASQGFGGPMFEPADSGEFKSIHRKSGAHYNTYSFDSMAALREFLWRAWHVCDHRRD